MKLNPFWFVREIARRREVENFAVLRNVREAFRDSADPWLESDRLLQWAEDSTTGRTRRLYRKWILHFRDRALRERRDDAKWKAIEALSRTLPRPL